MSAFSFEDGPEGPGLSPTQHEDFDDAPQFVDPEHPSMFGVMPPGYEQGGPGDPIIPTESPMPEENFDPQVDNDVVGLLFLGFLSRTAHVLGHTFVLKSLNGAEDLAVAQLVDEQPGLASQGKALMYAQVAASLLTVDGRSVLTQRIEQEASSAELIERLRLKIDYILKYHPAVVERLFEEYQELQLRVNAALRDYEGKLTAGRPSLLP